MSGFENDIVFAKNADFTSTDNQAPTESNGLVTDGQIWIGSTVVNAGGTHINVGTLTSTDSSVTVGYSAGNITLAVAGGTTVGKTITGNTGGPISPSGGNWNILGNGSLTIDGSGNTLATSLTGLTNHALLVGAGTSTITKVGPSATTGQILQSQGASADPAFSTATYPSASGGSGKILYDNGTNFVESTPTFPASASATSRKMIVSDGTNWVASTETWAVPGTSGNLLTSNGTNWTSAAPAASSFKYLGGFALGDNLNPADATTYYPGYSSSATWQTSDGQQRATFMIPLSGTINIVYAQFLVSGLGTAGVNSTLNLRKNRTTSTAVSITVDLSSATVNVNTTSLGLAVTAGDVIAFELVTGTWVTNPTGVSMSASFMVDV